MASTSPIDTTNPYACQHYWLEAVQEWWATKSEHERAEIMRLMIEGDTYEWAHRMERDVVDYATDQVYSEVMGYE